MVNFPQTCPALLTLALLGSSCFGPGLYLPEDEGRGVAAASFASSRPELTILTGGQAKILPNTAYDDDTQVYVNGVEANSYKSPEGEITIDVPEGLRSTKVELGVIQSSGSFQYDNAYSLQDGQVLLVAEAGTEVCSGSSYYDQEGNLQTGTKDCGAALPECTRGGETGCATNETFKSVDTTTLASKLASSASAAGVSGSISSCSSDGETGCITSSNYPALDTSAITEWDIKSGKSAGGIAGSVKTNCRNRANSTLFNYDGPVGSNTPTGPEAGGSAVDWWDTIDNFNNNTNSLPTAQPAGWSSGNICGKELWEDITPDGTCNSAVDDCMMKDNVTGLTWSEGYPVTGAASADSAATWGDAVDLCKRLDFGGIGAGSWRLPTQMELMQASVHGMRQVGFRGGTLVDSKDNNANFIADVKQSFWSATSQSSDTNNAWRVDFHNGFTSSNPLKTSSNRVICVSP